MEYRLLPRGRLFELRGILFHQLLHQWEVAKDNCAPQIGRYSLSCQKGDYTFVSVDFVCWLLRVVDPANGHPERLDPVLAFDVGLVLMEEFHDLRPSEVGRVV